MAASCDRLIFRGVLSLWAKSPNKNERTSPFLRRDAFGNAVIVPKFYGSGKGLMKILHFQYNF